MISLKNNDREGMPESLYRFVWRWSSRQQILLLVLSAIVFPLTLVPIELQRRIVNEAIESTQLRTLFVLCAIYAGVVVVQSGLKFSLNLYRGAVAEGIIRDLRHRVLARPDAKPDGAAQAEDSTETAEGTAVAILSAEVEPVGNFTGNAISVPVVEAGTLIFALVYMFVIEPVLAIIGVVLFIPQAILVPFVQRSINRRAEHRINVLRGISDTITEQRSQGADSPELAAAGDQVDEVFGIRISIFRLKFGLKATLNLVEHFSVIGILLVGGWLVISGDTQVGTVVAFLSGLQRLRGPWRDLIAYYRAAADARVKYGLVRQSLVE